MGDPELLERIKQDTKVFGNILWDTLTPFERERVLKRISKNLPDIEQNYHLNEPDSTPAVKPVEEKPPKPQKPIQAEPPESDIEQKFNEWDLKTKYRVAFADMIEQRTTIMKFLLNNYGIEAVEQFFLHDNPEWSEKLKVGKMKKIFAKMIAKLAPSMMMKRLAGIIISQAQYLVGVDHVTITEITDNYELLEITNCPVLKQFKKTLKALKFEDLEKHYVCSFACTPVLAQMCSVGNCNLVGEFHDRGCTLRVSIKAKTPDMLDQSEADPASIKNGR